MRQHRGPKAVVGAAILIVAAACSLAGSGSSPPATAHGCASTDVAGYIPAREYYISGFTPAPRLGRLPDRCFHTVGQALKAGFRPAPAPTEGELLGDGIYLVPVTQPLQDACRRAATVVGFAVPCPGLLLMSQNPIRCPTEDFPAPHSGGKDCVEDSAKSASLPSSLDTFTLQQTDMVLPDTYLGTASGANHMYVVGVAKASRLAPFRTACNGPETVEPGPLVRGQPASWVECPAGSSMHSGHVLLRWSEGSTLYVVSLHTHSAINRQIELAVAGRLVMVSPT